MGGPTDTSGATHTTGNGREAGMNSRNKPESGVPQAFLDELLSRTSMPAVASRMVRLERAANGRVWKSACPFHEDDGTSFYVHEDGFPLLRLRRARGRHRFRHAGGVHPVR